MPSLHAINCAVARLDRTTAWACNGTFKILWPLILRVAQKVLVSFICYLCQAGRPFMI